MSGASTWRGYVADVPYTANYHPQQAPANLELACLLNRIVGPLAGRQDDLVHVDLGCGRGRTALCLAASNPGWTVIGLDVMPAHVAEARALAAEAGIGNASFLEADLASFDPSTLPGIDVASAHGLWSWVDDPVRAGLVRLLAARLRAGGLLHLSYNALPGWQGSIGLQRLLVEAGDRIGGRSDRRAAGALELAQALSSAGAVHLADGQASELIGRARNASAAYLSHEFMNRHWRPCFHSDVLDALGPARLDFVGSAELLENFPALMLTPGQRAVCDRIDEPRLAELTRDLCLNRALRSDVFVRGARTMSREEQERRLRALTLCLLRPPEEVVYALKMPGGTATLQPEFFRPAVERLQQGNCRVGELLDGTASGRGGSALDLVGLLVGSGQAMVVSRPERAEPGEAASRLNRLLAARILGGETVQLAGLASLRLGAGMPAGADEAVVAAALASSAGGTGATGATDEADRLLRDAFAPSADPSRQGFLQDASALRARRLASWNRAGLLDADRAGREQVR